MTLWWEWVIWLAIIFLADIGAMVSLEYIRKRNTPDLKCDGCGKVRDLKRTPDMFYWMCKGCRARYIKEVRGDKG